MSVSHTADTEKCTVQKDLDDADRTRGYAAGHYSREEVAAMCDASEGQSHE